jgi:hypothetical protein
MNEVIGKISKTNLTTPSKKKASIIAILLPLKANL